MKINKSIMFGLLGLLAVLGTGGCVYLRSVINIPPLPLYDSSVVAERMNAECQNKNIPRLAIELLDLGQKVVFVSGGTNPISESQWDRTNVNFPQQKNSKRYLLFQNTCLLRSFDAAIDCVGEACLNFSEYYGHTWLKLNALSGQGCYPDSSGCNGAEVKSGFISITTIDKCQTLTFEGSINELSDDQGNRFVMHATASGTPQLDGVNLPKGWRLEKKILVAPLKVSPRGNGHCYFNILRDEKVQSYHQYVFAQNQFPPAAWQK